jgi:hypothetical protein
MYCGRASRCRSGDGIRAICGALIYTTGFVARELAHNRQQAQRAYRAAWLRTLSSLTPDDFRSRPA